MISLPDDIRITPSAMQRLVWSDTIVDGGTLRNLALPQPDTYKKDIMKIYRLMHFLPVLIMPVSYRFRGFLFTNSILHQPEQSMQLPVSGGALLRGCLKWRILRVGHTAVAPADTKLRTGTKD